MSSLISVYKISVNCFLLVALSQNQFFKLNTIILIGILVLWLGKKTHPKHSLATPYQPPRTS